MIMPHVLSNVPGIISMYFLTQLDPIDWVGVCMQSGIKGR
jgi:hypothetical protein